MASRPRYAWFFTPPTVAEIATLFKRWQINHEDAARMTDVTGKTIKRFVHGDEQMPYPVLYVLAAECGDVLISVGGWREELKI